jgi:Holliday junction DNA helicase RuvA
MIARLTGIVAEKNEEGIIIDVMGVGYRVFMSMLSLGKAPRVGEKVTVRVQTIVREDAFDLFGFPNEEEEALFKLLTTVSHVGPRVALGVLSGIEPGELADAIRAGNVNRLKSIHGVGKKTAERLVLELRDKVGLLGRIGGATVTHLPRPMGVAGELVSALVNLGYKPAEAEQRAESAKAKLGEDAKLESLLREALRAAR